MLDAFSTDTESIGSWKEAAVWSNKRCVLRNFDDERERYCLINEHRSRVQCQLISAEGTLSDEASINFDSIVRTIAAQWLRNRGQHRHRRAIVACSLDGESAPAILHFINA